MEAPNSFQPCVIGGTLLGISPVITSADVIKTVILAVLGAFVSFLVSIVLKHLILRRKK